MKTYNMNVINMPTNVIGFGGENGVTEVVLDFSSWAEEFGQGTISLLVRRAMDTDPYPAVLTVDGTTATWTITDVETSYKGHGEAQWIYTVGEQIKKSAVFGFNVDRSLNSPVADTPEAYQTWVDRMIELGADVEQIAQQVYEATGHYPKIENGYWYVWDVTNEDWVNTGQKAQGEQGEQGDPGVGISSTVLNADYTLTITFTDGSSYTTPPIRGEKGDAGNGISSTVLNPDYTLTITFTDGTTYTTPSIRGGKGDPGMTPDIEVGTVTTLDAGSDATVTITGTDEQPLLNFGIPKGDTGTIDTAIVAEDYANLTFPVAKGTPCIYEGDYYVAKQDIATSEAWTSAHWDQTNVGDDILSLKSSLHSISDDLYKRTKNLYDKDTAGALDHKFINSQAQLADSDYNAFSGFMPCEASTTYIFSIGGADVKVVSYWNNDTMLSRETINNGSFTTPATCNKIGFNLFATSHTTEEFNYAINHAQLELGTVATDYVPYIIKVLDTVVKVTEQTLTNDEKSQARDNIGAASASDLSDKLDAPSTAGTQGQVLTCDGEGGATWEDPQGGGVTVDSALSTTSENPVQNKVLTGVFNNLAPEQAGKNKFSPTLCGAENAYYYSTSNGTKSNSTAYGTTGKIPVRSNTTYTFSSTQKAIDYARPIYFGGDTGQTFLSAESSLGITTFTTPNNCTFVAINLFARTHTSDEFDSAMAVAQLELGSSATDYEAYKLVRIVNIENVEDGEKLESIFTEVHGKNLYDKSSCNPQNGKAYDTSGALSTSSSYAVTGKIPCSGGSTYIFSAGDAYVQFAVYYANNTFISREQIKGNSFTTPMNCTHVAFNLFARSHTTEEYDSAINSAQLEAGNRITTYEAYSSTSTPSYSFIEQGIGNNVGKSISQKGITDLLAYPKRSSWWNGKKGDSLGDSITYKFDRFQKFVKQYLNLAEFYNNGMTGTSMSGDSDPTWGDSMWMDSRINALHADADFITILGGANDSALVDIGTVDITNCDTDTYAGAFNVIISKIYYRYLGLSSGYYQDIDYSGVQQLSEPHNIIILPCTMFYVPGGIAKLKDKANAIRTLSEAWALKVCDFYGTIQANPFVADVYWGQSDNVHPTELFYKERLAPILIHELEYLKPMEFEAEPASV